MKSLTKNTRQDYVCVCGYGWSGSSACIDKLEVDIDLWLYHNKPNGGLFLTSLVTLNNLLKNLK